MDTKAVKKDEQAEVKETKGLKVDEMVEIKGQKYTVLVVKPQGIVKLRSLKD